MRVYKQKIKVLPVQTICIPIVETNNAIIDLGVQDGEPFIWFMAEDGLSKALEIYSCMTGENLPESLKPEDYIGNYILSDSMKIHVFVKNGITN